MSKKYAIVAEFWSDVASSSIRSAISKQRNLQVEAELESAIAIYTYVVEDLVTKRQKNRELALLSEGSSPSNESIMSA